MDLQPLLTDPTMNEESLQKATAIRDAFLPKMTEILGGPHFPELNQDEKDRITDKVIGLLQAETRPRYWHNLGCQLNPTVKDGVTKLTPTLLLWAGRRKKAVHNHDPKQTIGHAKNGRVVRGTRNLS